MIDLTVTVQEGRISADAVGLIPGQEIRLQVISGSVFTNFVLTRRGSDTRVHNVGGVRSVVTGDRVE